MISPVMHQRIDFHMDKVRSPRLSPQFHKDQALNVAQEKAFNIMVDLFQFKQYLRDEMRPLVKMDVSVPVTGNVITLPSDYRHVVHLQAVIDGRLQQWIQAMTFNERGQSTENAFTDPNALEAYWIESDGGIKIMCGAGVVSSATMDYIRRPKTIYYSQQFISFGPSVLTPGQTYYVQTGTITHNATVYRAGNDTRPGDTFVAANSAFTGTGTVAAIQNCEFGETCHEELCKISSAILSGNLEDYSRFQVKASESRR